MISSLLELLIAAKKRPGWRKIVYNCTVKKFRKLHNKTTFCTKQAQNLCIAAYFKLFSNKGKKGPS